MPFTTRLSEQLAVVACIDPDEYSAGAVNSDIIDMRYHRRVIFIVQAGTLGTNATVNFKVQEGAQSNMSDAADLAGKAITELTEAGTDADKQAILEVAAEEITPGDRYLWGVLTIGTAACDAGVIALADCARYVPASDYDLASVDEIVA